MLRELGGIAKDSRRRERLLWAAAVVAPIVAFQAISWVTDSGPASAQAAPVAPPSGVDELVAPRVPAEALAWLAALDRSAPPTSPMDTPPVEVFSDPHPQEHHPEPAPAGHDGLVLTGIIESNGGTFASINRRRYKVGSQVAQGLVVKSIDARSRSVTLVDERGEERVLRVETPKLDDRRR